MPHRIYIIEDHLIVRETVCEIINSEDDLEVAGVAASAEEALNDPRVSDADVILVDNSLPAMNGIGLIEALLERQPEARCLMFSAHEEPAYLRRASEAGARGYVVKGCSKRLLETIRDVLAEGPSSGAALRESGSDAS